MSDYVKVGLMGLGLVVFDLFFWLNGAIFDLVNQADVSAVICGVMLFLIIICVNVTVGALMYRRVETMVDKVVKEDMERYK